MFAQGTLGASFFCSRDFEDRSNLKLIFPTLALQLAHKYPTFRSVFVRLVQLDPDIVHESLYGQMKKMIVQPLAESAISTVIVIDALDECQDDEPASSILSVVGKFIAEIPNTKFFITGRPESHIREGFRLPFLAQVTDIYVLHEVGLDDQPSEEQMPNEDQEYPTSEGSTSSAAVGGTNYRGKPLGECSRSWRLRMTFMRAFGSISTS